MNAGFPSPSLRRSQMFVVACGGLRAAAATAERLRDPSLVLSALLCRLDWPLPVDRGEGAWIV